MKEQVIHGDCLEVLRTLPDACVDAVVTDPPAGISFMGREWDSDKGGRDAWIAWLSSVMRECLRVLKPGGHAFVWALPRTSHWTGMALEDAGFEVRDRLAHLFGTGFPKSLDVSKAIDAAAGAERDTKAWCKGEAGGIGMGLNALCPECGKWMRSPDPCKCSRDSGPATPEAARWSGWGTALKPACEDWWLARKPLISTVAQNVLAHGTGGLNIDGCRIESAKRHPGKYVDSANPDATVRFVGSSDRSVFDATKGRWPANVVLSHYETCTDDACTPGCAVAMLDEQSGALHKRGNRGGTKGSGLGYMGGVDSSDRLDPGSFGDSGGASRFFYCAKPSRRERDAGCEHLPPRSGGEATDREDGSDGLKSPRAGAGRTGGARNHHPTVKSVALMRWLCRLITPPGGVVLDPFCGSGSTGVAAVLEGFRFIGIEREADYAEIARSRIAHHEKSDPVTEEPRQRSLFGDE